MMIALTYEESEKIPKLIQELISLEDEANQCKDCDPSSVGGCEGCSSDYNIRRETIEGDPLMQQPIIREYVYAMLRQHKYKKEIDKLQEKINETYNIEKNYQKSIVVGDFYND